MSTRTENFNLVLPEGTDTFNPLTFNNNAFTRIDAIMKANQDRGLSGATHVYLDGINTISRHIPTCNLFVFTATADYEPTSQIAVDGVTVTFRYADGSAPAKNAFRTNQAVICYLNGSILTLVSAGSLANVIGDLSTLATTNKDTIVSAINELNTDLSEKTPIAEFNKLRSLSNLNLIKLTNANDLNNIEDGMYYSTDGNDPANKPTSSNNNIYWQISIGSRIAQFCYSMNSNNIYSRRYSGGWSDWVAYR